MAAEESKSEEKSASLDAQGAGSAAVSGGISAEASQKSEQKRKKAPKLGQKANSEEKLITDTGGEQQNESESQEANGESLASAGLQQVNTISTPKSRRQSRGRRRSRQPDSETESIRSETNSVVGGSRRRNRKKSSAKTQEKQSGLGGVVSGGPLGGIDEVGETLDGVTDTAGGAVDKVQDTLSSVGNKAGEAVGGLLGGGKKGKKGGEGKGKDEQLRLRLDINLDIEIQLKAKIHGDLTIGLLYVCCLFPFFFWFLEAWVKEKGEEKVANSFCQKLRNPSLSLGRFCCVGLELGIEFVQRELCAGLDCGWALKRCRTVATL